MKRRLLLILGLVFLFVSCVDPICYEYKATVFLKNVVADNTKYCAWIADSNNKSIVTVYLSKDNNFIDSDGIWSMGPQLDYRDPDEKLRLRLDEIKKGGVYTIAEFHADYTKTPKYIIECTPEDVKEIIDDRLYRCYEITLDWNKRVAIAE